MEILAPSFFYTVLLPEVATPYLKTIWLYRVKSLRRELLLLKNQMETQDLFHAKYHHFLKQQIKQLDVYVIDLEALDFD